MIRFRIMTKEDAAGVEVVEKASFAMPWSRQSFWEEAANDKTCYLLTLDEERIIGYMGAWLLLEEAHITNVAVLPEYRGKGIGSKMLAEYIRVVREKGITAMTLEVRPSNQSAIALYEKFGFHSVGLRKGYYQDNGEAAMIMWNTKL